MHNPIASTGGRFRVEKKLDEVFVYSSSVAAESFLTNMTIGRTSTPSNKDVANIGN